MLDIKPGFLEESPLLLPVSHLSGLHSHVSVTAYRSLLISLGPFQSVVAVSKNSAQGWGSFVPGMPASLMLALPFSMCVE